MNIAFTRWKSYVMTACILLMQVKTWSQQTRAVWLDELPVFTYSEGIRPVKAAKNYAGDVLQVQGKEFSRGIGAQSISIIDLYLDGKATHFSAKAAVDDNGNKDIPLNFYVLADRKIVFQKLNMHLGDMPVPFDVNLKGVKKLGLLITDAVGGIRNKKTYADWLDAKIEMIGSALPQHTPNDGKRYILTPPDKSTPAIHSPMIYGARPGNPVLYTIAATGQRPMFFSAKGLPEGLRLSTGTGFIEGRVQQPGHYSIQLSARNALGESKQQLDLYIGDTIAYTPPIGWNGWNCYEQKITQDLVLKAAKAMLTNGLREHGWQYINIDDSWQGIRTGKDTALQPNEKFPDIVGMVNQIHAMGLKAGIYSTPYIGSYAGYVGASSKYPAGGETMAYIKQNRPKGIGPYRFERQDAKQMAEWGFDFLKYDWRIDVESAERMSKALKESGRDIIFSLSNNAPFEKVNDWVRTAQMYRTGPDIKDSWNSLYTTVFSLDDWSPYAGHGHWSDADMMILGKVSIGAVLHDTKLTPDEQYSHVSIFSLLAAPMLIGCPLDSLDAFTLNLLKNDEVIAIDQDPLGKAGRRVYKANGFEIWKKEMHDGSVAIGIFNNDGFGETPQSYFRWGNEKERSFVFDFAMAGLSGAFNVHDAWRQKDMGTYTGKLPEVSIPYHGVLLLRCYPKTK